MIIIFKIRKNSTTTRKILQCPELVRVKHGNVRIFPSSIIHGGGFLNSKSIGNARIQLHVYLKSHSGSNINNRYFKDYNFKNVTAEQLKLYKFEQSKQHVLKESNECLSRRKYTSARANNNDQSSVSHGNNGRYPVDTNQDSQSSLLTTLTNHIDKKCCRRYSSKIG